jgi:hypothetical protein
MPRAFAAARPTVGIVCTGRGQTRDMADNTTAIELATEKPARPAPKRFVRNQVGRPRRMRNTSVVHLMD